MKQVFFDKVSQTYEKSYIKLSNLKYKKNIFYEFQTQNDLHIFVFFYKCCQHSNSDAHKNY